MIRSLFARVALVFAFVALFAFAPALAQEEEVFSVAPAVLSEEDQSWLSRTEDYFNSIQSIRAGFLQTSSEGGAAEGVFYLRRPGLLRVEYLPPTPVLIVGDGLFLHFHDTELGQVSDWPIFDTPLGAISADEVRFNEDLIVTGFQRRSGALAITLVKREDPGLGSLTLYFSEKPMALRQWKVIDAQGLVTSVALFDAETNIALDNRLFVFDDPREQQQGR
jgi:outer membrane lipoprotein-sorting protein